MTNHLRGNFCSYLGNGESSHNHFMALLEHLKLKTNLMKSTSQIQKVFIHTSQDRNET